MPGSFALTACSAALMLAVGNSIPTVFGQDKPGDQTAPPEFRGMWVTRFEWPDADPAKARAYIDRVMADLAAHRFNAVLFQVRGQADTFYPSPEEPWSPLIAPDMRDPGWDPLQYALDQARAHGLEFHAYLNTHVAWQDHQERPPPAPDHLFYQHCDAADPARRDWLIHDEQGQPVQFDSDHYVWIAPGVPEVQAYIRRQIMHVVTRYDVDGLHFDRIRMPDPRYSHDPISAARQTHGAEGNPAGLDFADWTRDQFTRLLCDLYAQVAEVKPRIKISAAPVGLYRQERYPDYPSSFLFGWSKGYQDAQAWMAAGALDFVVPQIYWADGPPPPDFGHILPDWIAHAAGRHVVAGQNRSLDLDELERQVRFTRDRGGQGNVMFHYGGFAKKGGLKRYSRPGGVYERPAATPPMPWKEQPADGIIIGSLTDPAGRPIVDAQVTRSGSDDVALSSGDGLYAFLKVPPGPHTLTVRKRGFATDELAVDVACGLVSRADVILTPQTAPIAAATPPSAEPAADTTAPPIGQVCRPRCIMPYIAAALLLILIAVAAVTLIRRRPVRPNPN